MASPGQVDQGVRKRSFEPLPAQREFMEATHPEVMYSGAFGAGKSRVGCEKALFLSQYYPGNVGLIARKHFSDLRHTTLKTLLEEVLPEDHIIEHHKHEHRIELRTRDPDRPSTIYYMGLDRSTAIASMNLGWCFVDEAIEIEQEAWAMLEGRLRLNTVPFHQIFTATNPGSPAHWLYERFYREDPRDENGNPLRCVVESNALENPHNPEPYRQRLQRFTGIHYERFVEGKWVGYEGLVYPEFDPRKHVIDAFHIPDDWPRYASVDFGTANPFVHQWWAEDPSDGTLILYREIYMTGRSALDHARHIQKLEKHEPEPAWRVADHDLGDRHIMHDEGVYTNAAIKDVQEGIQAVKNRLEPRTLYDVNEEDLDLVDLPPGAYTEQTEQDGVYAVRRPGILFFRNALVREDARLINEDKPLCTREEFGGYEWAEGTHDTIKDEPRKKNDHGMDAMRYFVMEVDQGEQFALVEDDVFDGVL